jgi:hypothetical protein
LVNYLAVRVSIDSGLHLDRIIQLSSAGSDRNVTHYYRCCTPVRWPPSPPVANNRVLRPRWHHLVASPWHDGVEAREQFDL